MLAHVRRAEHLAEPIGASRAEHLDAELATLVRHLQYVQRLSKGALAVQASISACTSPTKASLPEKRPTRADICRAGRDRMMIEP
mmetsp:Transcript_60212/g.160236  ORF Transcript_60212/g.160236 Transcript_60212/m.160236 type:complete len:85 (-) Transcript_60212:206-460(-)